MTHVYEVGSRCWHPDEREGWLSSEIVNKKVNQDGSVTLEYRIENGERTTIDTTLAVLEDPKETTLPPLRNPPSLEAIDDLTDLSHLNEPSVLYAIRKRYAQLDIYTYSGMVLIATNPFQKVDSHYTQDVIHTYSGRQRGELEPHLFAIAEDAYRYMLRDNMNQTIVVSGESGAGKTVSAKYIMRYFALVEDSSKPAKSKHMGEVMSKTEEQILATNPIMEAFGNAKTTRNDNSSRFGKYIEIMFDPQADIVGAKIRTYLLERSRLVFQPATERNYHILYQLCAGATDLEKEQFELLPVMDYFYLNQGSDPKIPNVDDAGELQVTRDALTTIGLSSSTQFEIFKILAALLHIGNVEISIGRNASLSSSEPSLVIACRLLGVDAVQLAKWITKRQIITRNEKIVTDLTPKQANVVRDSVAKFVYSSLFEWLVARINQNLAKGEALAKSFIGVLDIYGFEHFQKNSFEQFCINYANEKLQQEFNQHVFKLEQDLYIQEEIKWDFIDFSDNQPCIDLIEAKLGILSLLDEESRLPAGSDDSWTTKLYQHFTTPNFNGYFKKPRFGKSAFTVRHYAMEVTYDSEGFIEKNRDTVPDELIEVLQGTSNGLLKEVFAVVAAREKQEEPAPSATKGKVAKARKPTLGGIFKLSLIDLMNTINSTNVHYIRCIKPNETKSAWQFEPQMVLNQLRACGVLETIRISCAGFPTRLTYDEFAFKYYVLVNSSQRAPDSRKFCVRILGQTIKQPGKYQLGRTKIFLRAGVLAFLEQLRAGRLDEAAIMIQKNLRARFYRRQYLDARTSILLTQRIARGYLARRLAQEMRRERAATLIQKVWQCQKQRKIYLQKRKHILLLQTVARGYMARKCAVQMKYENAASVISQAWRSYHSKRKFAQHRQKIVLVQSLVRRRLARKQLLSLKTEARSVSHYKEVSYKLENKVFELTQNLAQKMSDNKALTQQLDALQHKFSAWDKRLDVTDSRNRELEAEASKTSEVIARAAQLEDQLRLLREQYHKSVANFDRLEKENKKLQESLSIKSFDLGKALSENSLLEETQGSLRDEVDALRIELRKLSANGAMRKGAQSNGILTKAFRRAGVSGKRQSYDHSNNLVGEDIKKGFESYQARPASMIIPRRAARSRQTSQETVAARSVDQIEDDITRLLFDNQLLSEELILGLVQNPKIPVPSASNSATPLSETEVLFPGNLISLWLTELWRRPWTKGNERLLAAVLQSIQEQVMSYEGEDCINPGAFWVSNLHQILSYTYNTESEIMQHANLQQARDDLEWAEYTRVVSMVKCDLETVEYNIYHTWVKEMKKKIHKMIVPAVVESQSLPGFVTPDNPRFLGKLLPFGSSQTASMDDLLGVLNKIHKTMNAYYLESQIMQQVVTELLKMIGVTAFNDLLMRRNFLSWKRGLQINYNTTRVEEWCKTHDFPEGKLQLEPLVQATKLLHLRKTTMSDIEVIYDICWILNPTQVSKLINQYHTADYEQPINGDILKVVANKVILEKNDILLLDAVSVNESGMYDLPPGRDVRDPGTYVPSWLQVPNLRRLAELVQVRDEGTPPASENGVTTEASI